MPFLNLCWKFWCHRVNGIKKIWKSHVKCPLQLVVNVSVCVFFTLDWQRPGKHQGSQKIKDYFYKLNWALETLGWNMCVCGTYWSSRSNFFANLPHSILQFSTGVLIKVAELWQLHQRPGGGLVYIPVQEFCCYCCHWRLPMPRTSF